jgi:hypothetical protein
MVFLVGLYHISRKLSLLVVWDLSSNSMFVAVASILTNVTYASWSGPNKAVFQKIMPPEVTANWLPAILKLVLSPVQLVPMAPSRRLKESNTPVAGKSEETGVAVAVSEIVGVDVIVLVSVVVGVFDTIGVNVLVDVVVGEFVAVNVYMLVGVLVNVLVAVGVDVRVGVRVGVIVDVRVGVDVKVPVAVIEGPFVTVGWLFNGAVISYIFPSMMLGSLLLSIPRSTM